MRTVLVVLGLAYPLLVLAGLSRFEPRAVALVVGAIALLRLVGWRRGRRAAANASLVFALLGVGGLIALAAVLNDERYLRLLPVLINVVLCAAAASSLIGGTPLVETFARMQVDYLSAEEVRYCRKVTAVWCGFFALNALVIAWLSIAAGRDVWALYTGALAYVLVGLLFAGEYVYRHYRFRRYLGGPSDALLKRLFPPHEGG